MNICLACYNDRLASVFDNTSELKFYEVSEDSTARKLTFTKEVHLSGCESATELATLINQDSGTLICGAICGCTRRKLEQSSISIIPWIKGSVAQVLEAYCHNTLDAQAMPGCHNQRLIQSNGQCQPEEHTSQRQCNQIHRMPNKG
ncbi:MAG: NifB/NifX family molybdenum-iron cluster-binding protein [Desulfovibrio sp.]